MKGKQRCDTRGCRILTKDTVRQHMLWPGVVVAKFTAMVHEADERRAVMGVIGGLDSN